MYIRLKKFELQYILLFEKRYIPLHMTSDTNPYSRRVVRVAGKGRHHNDSS